VRSSSGSGAQSPDIRRSQLVLTPVVAFRRHGRLSLRLAAAVGIVALASALRLAAPGLSNEHLSYVVFFPAVALAWLVGRWPAALLATSLCVVIERFWLTPAASPADLLSFVVVCLVVTGLSELLEQNQLRLAASEAQLLVEQVESEGEQRLRLLVEATSEYAIIMLDADGHIASWNEGARRSSGYEADEVVGRHVALFYTAEEVAAGKPALDLDKARREGRLEEEGERVRKDGTRFWASTVVTPLMDGTGELRGFLRITRDTSERRRAEQETAEVHARLESVVASAMDAIVTIDASHHIVLFNPAAELMFGYKAGNVIGQPLDIILPARFRERHRQHIAAFAETKVSNRTMGRLGEISGLRADGREFPIEASISQADVSGRRLLTVILRDVTERKRAETALTESDERMRLALKASNAGVWVWDAASDLITVDGAYRILYGFQPGETIDGASWQARIHPDDRASHNEQVRWCIENDGQWREEFRILHPALGERWLAGRGKVLLGAKGEVTGMTGINFDITENKRAEEHMRFVMRELSHRTKNILAVVQAMAWQSSQNTIDIEEFLERFTRRIESLRRSHDLLVKRAWEGVGLADLVRGQLSPFLDDASQRLAASGPQLLVKPSGAEDLGLVLHELATNASKYGALSVPGGRITVDWLLEPDAKGRPILQIRWREQDGAPVTPPRHCGFGTTVIKDMMAMTKKAEITLDYAPSGVVWQMRVLAERMLDCLACAEDGNANIIAAPSKPDVHSYEI